MRHLGAPVPCHYSDQSIYHADSIGLDKRPYRNYREYAGAIAESHGALVFEPTNDAD